MQLQLKRKSLAFLMLIMLFSSNLKSQNIATPPAKLMEEIRQIESQFESDLNMHGAGYAFEKYADSNAVIKRENDTLIIGRAAIKKYYSNTFYTNAKAFWKPDYIGFSQDGTMAYTYGKYRWLMADNAGKVQEYKGVFHTVWKRQSNGLWKYVWD